MTLAAMTVALGAVAGVLGVWLVGVPAGARRTMARFPRSRAAAWVLTTAVLLWSGYLLYHGPLGVFLPYRDWLYGLVPLAILLVGFFVDELLAPRALGGLLILIPAPLLAVARWHASPWRYVVIVLAYIMVLKGAALIAAPYWFRKSVERWLRTDAQCRAWGGVALLEAVGLLALGMCVY